VPREKTGGCQPEFLMVTNVLIVFGAALALSLALTPWLRRFIKVRFLDEEAIPRFGGMAIFLSFILPFSIVYLILSQAPLDGQWPAILGGAFAVLLIGAYDDWKGASVGSRLVVEIGAACLLFFAGIGIHTLPNPFGQPLALGWLSLPVTVLWVVVITNAINLIDGLDGLAAGTSILILTAILLMNGQSLPAGLALAALALIGALAGFLFYNHPPASIYMGDSGSLFLGFFLATFAMAVSRGTSGSSSIGVMVLAFSLPLLDMMYAIVRRWYRGMPIYKSDTDHLHHKLLQKGYSKRQVLSWFYGANLLLLIALYLLFKVDLPRPLAIIIPAVLSLIAFWGFQLLSELKPADFVRKIGLLFADFKKRRYHLYLINRFEREAEKKKEFIEISGPLGDLFKDYGFSAGEIERQAVTIYAYSDKDDEKSVYSLEFPLTKKGEQLGSVRLRKPFNRGPIYCSGELAQALSDCLGRVLAP